MHTADDVASVIIARNGSWLTAMTLQKLLYYVQAWHLAITDEPLFVESFKAWKQGPVVPQVWHARKDQASRRAADQEPVEVGSETLDLIDLVLATYGSMSGDELSVLTHAEKPWLEARGDLAPEESCSNVVEPESIATFYRAHRKLGGRTAADLAAGGLHLESHEGGEPFDVAAYLDELGPDYDDAGEDALPGGNLEAPLSDSEGVGREQRRAYASA